VKFTLSPDLSEVAYEGIIASDPLEAFYNLECSDTFKVGDTYYLTYSGQDDTLWYAMSDFPYGPFDEPRRIDDELFYAAKHVEDGDNCHLVGWLRRSESPASTDEVSAWGGNLVVQKVCQNDDGSLYLQPVDAVKEGFQDRRELLIKGDSLKLKGTGEKTSTAAFTAYERFLITGDFSFSGTGTFGLSFDMNEEEDSRKLVTVSPNDELVTLSFNGGDTLIASTLAKLKPDTTYSFTYLQEGSCGVFYVDGVASLSVRLYGVSGNPIALFAQDADVTFSNLREYTAPTR
jgi:sucrose-6-phosphate hydrolase SacC (GH32 family)